MYLDKNLEFDPNGTAVTVTAVSTNVLDLGVARDLGAAPEGMGTLEIAVYVIAAFAAAGAATLNIQVQGAPDNGAGAPGAWTTLAESGVIGKAALIAGAKFDMVLPSQQMGAAIPRFLRLNYVVATGPFTAGTVQAELLGGLEHIPTSAAGFDSGYPSGFTVNN